MSVRDDARFGGEYVAHGEHRAPLREARAHRPILLQSVAKSVESFSDSLRGRAGQRLCAHIDLDASEDAQPPTYRHERRSIGALLTDRFVVHDHAAQKLCGAGRRDQHLAIVSPSRWCGWDSERVEAFR